MFASHHYYEIAILLTVLSFFCICVYGYFCAWKSVFPFLMCGIQENTWDRPHLIVVVAAATAAKSWDTHKILQLTPPKTAKGRKNTYTHHTHIRKRSAKRTMHILHLFCSSPFVVLIYANTHTHTHITIYLVQLCETRAEGKKWWW